MAVTLAENGFALGLHGHIHEAMRSEIFGSYARLPVISAGSLCAGSPERPESIPYQYNVIGICGNHRRAWVHVRSRKRKELKWLADKQWGPKQKCWYEINLSPGDEADSGILAGAEHLGTWELEDCVRRLSCGLASLAPTKVTINHLGLDMQQAWRHIRDELFHKYSENLRFEYRLLVVAGSDFDELKKQLPSIPDSLKKRIETMKSLDEYQGNPDQIQTMRKAVGAALKLMINTVEEEARDGEVPGLHLMVKMYTDIPIIHGLSTDQPRKTHYFAFCRWKGKTYDQYDWGSGKYHMVCAPSPQSPYEDLTGVFDSYFEHLWINSGDLVYEYLATRC